MKSFLLAVLFALACGNGFAATAVIDWHVDGGHVDGMGGISQPFPNDATQGDPWKYDPPTDSTYISGPGMRYQDNLWGLNSFAGISMYARMKASKTAEPGHIAAQMFMLVSQGGNGANIFDGPGACANFGVDAETGFEFQLYDFWRGNYLEWSSHGIDTTAFHAYLLEVIYNPYLENNVINVYVDGVLEDPDALGVTAYWGRGGAGQDWVGFGHQRWDDWNGKTNVTDVEVYDGLVIPIPEPSSLVTLAGGILALAGVAVRRRR